MCAISFCSRAESHKFIYQSVSPGTQMSLKHAENKNVKPKQEMRGLKIVRPSFLLKREMLWVGLSKQLALVCNIVFMNTTITSSVNGRTFSVINKSDLDCKTETLIYALT